MSADIPIHVSNTSFAIDRMAKDCGPLQYLREFTQNGLEAIAALGGQHGEIVWAEDEWSQPAEDCAGRKLCVYDTGSGMNAAELEELVGNLFSSGRVQGLGANFGVGAKISSLPGNPHGVVYTTLKEGKASQLRLYRNLNGQWVKETDLTGSATWDAAGQLPPAIEAAGHGTMVTFLGHNAEEDTVAHPDHSDDAKTTWLVKWLNSRYFRLPDTVDLRAGRLEGAQKGRRTIVGQKAKLDSCATHRGSLKVNGGAAEAHWWIIDEKKASNDASYATLRGHVAAVFDDELYEMTRPGPSSYAHLRSCGVTFGCKNVVVYFELLQPFVSQVVSDTARTRLIHKDGDFPLEDFELAFAKTLPAELKEHVERSAPSADDPHRAADVRRALEEALQRFGFQRYRASWGGESLADDEALPGSQPGSAGQGSGTGSTPPGDRGGTSGSGDLRGGDKVEAKGIAGLNLPKVTWVSVNDDSRNKDEMEDRAAQYVFHDHLVLVNADFRGFTSLEEYWRKELTGVIGADEAIRSALRTEVELALVEAVASISYFKQDKGTWKANDREAALSPEALTAVALQRYRFDRAIARAVKKLMKQTAHEDR